MKIVGLYLAAGTGSRMGTNKLMLPVGTKTLGSLALETALQTSLERVYVVTNEVKWILPYLKEEERCQILFCPEAETGQSASLRRGIRQAIDDNADGVVVMLADQPFITVQLVEELIECYSLNRHAVFVGVAKNDLPVPPLLLNSFLFDQLLQLSGDEGARALLRGELQESGHLLPCTDQRLVFDIDTKEDYSRLLRMLAAKE